MSLLEKAYFVQSDDKFARFFEGFFVEVDAYFDDLRMDGKGLLHSDDEAEFTNQEIQELEDFMDKHTEKGKR